MKYLLALFLLVFAGSALADGITIRSGDGHGTNTLFYDSSGVLSLGVTARRTYDGGGVIFSQDWDARVQYDTVGVAAHSWGARLLRDSVGAVSINYDARTFSGAWAFGSITNHSDVSAGAFVSGGYFGYDGIAGKFTNGLPSTYTAPLLTNSFGATFDGAMGVIQTNITRYLVVPYNCTIKSFYLLSDTASTSVIEIMRCTFAEFDAGATHPVVADKITASLPPTITATKTNVISLGTWSPLLTNGNVLAFRTITNTAATALTLTLIVEHAP